MKLKITKEQYFKIIGKPEHKKWFKNKMAELGFNGEINNESKH